MTTTKKLGKILLDYGLISGKQLNLCLEEQKRTRKKLGEILVQLGFVDEVDIAEILSSQLGIPYTDLTSAVIEPEAIELVQETWAQKFTVLPMSVDNRYITVAIADPLDLEALNGIKFATDKVVKPVIATRTDIIKAIKKYYNLTEPLQEVLDEMVNGHLEVLTDNIEVLREVEVEEAIKESGAPPIIRMVNNIIIHAVNNRVSDIHVEPRKKTVIIRERVDGLLVEAHQIPKWVQGSVTSRIKIMASMDIAEKRIPQDGRIKVTIGGKELDIRVSTLPTQYGEKIVLRILDSDAALLNLEDVGLKKNDYINVVNLIKKPQGMLLVTGPTGSGKSSTLHAITNHIKTEAINIVTLEDPIEYEHKGVNQVAINESTGLGFAHGLRSILRQDPDIIMVGEMRDSETANIAVQASITGHLVLTTLHTNTAVAAITRLKNLGIPPYLIASSLNGVIAQRLVRKLCNKCKKAFSPSDEDLIKIGLKEKIPSHLKFYKEVGCESCGHTGYSGRIGVFEILIISSDIRKLIANNAIEDVILKSSLDAGMKYMSEDGIEKVKEGGTSINELTRVLYATDKEAINICPDCSETVRHDFLICPYCSYLLVNECLNCGKPRERAWKYCPFCRDEFA